MDARAMFANDAAAAEAAASFNATLQTAYLILALRAVGLEARPMGGFDRDTVDTAFFAGTSIRSILLINIGHGDASKLYPRSPRLDFSEIASFA